MDLVTGLYLVVCVMLVLAVLIQQGSGADAGVSFGGGGNTLFGASGADNLLVKITTGLAAVFMCFAVYLTYTGKSGVTTGGTSFFGDLPEASYGTTTEAPVAPITEGAPVTPIETTPITSEAE